MVHNGIEYGLMQAYAEGYELMAATDLVTNVTGVLQAWSRGTVVRSWLLDLLVLALKDDPGLAKLSDYVDDSGEGRWTIEEAIRHAVPLPVISAALFARFSSRQESSPSMRAVAALRHQFGGHAVHADRPVGHPRSARGPELGHRLDAVVARRRRTERVHLRRLAVADFRSWERAELDLEPGVSVLVGPNGVGKTNLVEAVGYLATLGSHRVAGDAPLVRRGAERAVARATVVHEGRELTVELEIAPGRANRARVNRAPVARPRDVLGILRTVLFAPGGPRAGARRPGRAAPVPRRPAGRPPAPVRRGPRRLRPRAQPALGAAQDRPRPAVGR